MSLSKLKVKGGVLLAFIHLTNTDHAANAPFVQERSIDHSLITRDVLIKFTLLVCSK